MVHGSPHTCQFDFLLSLDIRRFLRLLLCYLHGGLDGADDHGVLAVPFFLYLFLSYNLTEELFVSAVKIVTHATASRATVLRAFLLRTGDVRRKDGESHDPTHEGR